MPKKTLISPEGSLTKNALKNGSNYNTVHDATAAASINDDNKLTLHAKAGANYFVRRGIIVYDFTGVPMEQNIRVIRARLILNDTNVLSPQTDGNKVRVGWIFNPNGAGTIHVNDYDKARYAAASYTTAQAVANGVDGAPVVLNNRMLLTQLEKAINNKQHLHLVIRNQLDYADTTATGNNRVWFDGMGDSFNDDMKLEIWYRRLSAKRNSGGGVHRTSRSGFTGVSTFSGTNSGFGN